MKKKKYLQILVCLCALSLVSGFASHNEPLGNINNISITSGIPSTKVILQSDSPLTLFSSSYAGDRPSTLLVNFDGVDTSAKPDMSTLTSPLVKDMRLTKIDSDTFRLEVDLKERVPYQIISDKNNTIVELNHIQRSPGKYVLSPETKSQLTQTANPMSYLTNIDVSEKIDRIDVRAALSHQAVSNIFVLEKPLRLVVDLYNTYFSTSKSEQSINKLGVKKVRAAQFQISNPFTVTRMVFDLAEPRLYSLNTTDNSLTISFYNDRTVRSSPALSKSLPKPATFVAETAEIPPPVIREDNSVKSTPKPSVKKEDPPVEKVTTSKPIAPEEKIELPENLKPEKNGSSTKRFQEEQFKPKTITDRQEEYSGEAMTLKFKDADLRDIITYIGEHVGLNVVFDPEVRGVVTCNLVDVPWDQALDILLKTNKMGRTLEGNVLRIAPIGTITREREDLQKLEESKELEGPLLTKSFPLSYSKASDVDSLLRNKLSTRGEMIVDIRTNTLVITDVRDRVELLESLIDVFDTPTPQVAIEARIVEATSQFVKNLGIQWGVRGIVDPFYGNQTSLQFPHKVLVDGALIPQGIVTKGIGGPLGGYAINLPAPAFTTAMGVSFANVLDTFRLDMAISAMETSGNGRIISSPSVTTQNNQEAEIIQGRQIPVQTVANFTVTTRYINAALELRATPQITAEGTIIMHLELRNNAADFANLVNGIPPIITQSAMTTVMIPDGGTTVIGGIYRTEDSITRDRVPFFHKIPILGNLFKSFARTKSSRELLIFITPRILR
jgi:type IV pilus secretin PilQ/predicted competence protein